MNVPTLKDPITPADNKQSTSNASRPYSAHHRLPSTSSAKSSTTTEESRAAQPGRGSPPSSQSHEEDPRYVLATGVDNHEVLPMASSGALQGCRAPHMFVQRLLRTQEKPVRPVHQNRRSRSPSTSSDHRPVSARPVSARPASAQPRPRHSLSPQRGCSTARPPLPSAVSVGESSAALPVACSSKAAADSVDELLAVPGVNCTEALAEAEQPNEPTDDGSPDRSAACLPTVHVPQLDLLSRASWEEKPENEVKAAETDPERAQMLIHAASQESSWASVAAEMIAAAQMAADAEASSRDPDGTWTSTGDGEEGMEEAAAPTTGMVLMTRDMTSRPLFPSLECNMQPLWRTADTAAPLLPTVTDHQAVAPFVHIDTPLHRVVIATRGPSAHSSNHTDREHTDAHKDTTHMSAATHSHTSSAPHPRAAGGRLAVIRGRAPPLEDLQHPPRPRSTRRSNSHPAQPRPPPATIAVPPAEVNDDITSAIGDAPKRKPVLPRPSSAAAASCASTSANANVRPSSAHTWRSEPKPWRTSGSLPPTPTMANVSKPTEHGAVDASALHLEPPMQRLETPVAKLERLEIPTGSDSRQARPRPRSSPTLRDTQADPKLGRLPHADAERVEPRQQPPASSTAAAHYVPPPARTVMLQLQVEREANDSGEYAGFTGRALRGSRAFGVEGGVVESTGWSELERGVAGEGALPPEVAEEDSEYRDYTRYLDEHPELLRSTLDVGWPSFDRRRPHHHRAKSAPYRHLHDPTERQTLLPDRRKSDARKKEPLRPSNACAEEDAAEPVALVAPLWLRNIIASMPITLVEEANTSEPTPKPIRKHSMSAGSTLHRQRRGTEVSCRGAGVGAAATRTASRMFSQQAPSGSLTNRLATETSAAERELCSPMARLPASGSEWEQVVYGTGLGSHA